MEKFLKINKRVYPSIWDLRVILILILCNHIFRLYLDFIIQLKNASLFDFIKTLTLLCPVVNCNDCMLPYLRLWNSVKAYGNLTMNNIICIYFFQISRMTWKLHTTLQIHSMWKCKMCSATASRKNSKYLLPFIFWES